MSKCRQPCFLNKRKIKSAELNILKLRYCLIRFQQQCSQNAYCSDYATGFCCHCQPGFYGNGRYCLPDGWSGTINTDAFQLIFYLSFYFLCLKCHRFLSNSSATPPGAPQRVSGKVFGKVNVGSTTVELNKIDLHAYIVVGDGRAYTAISEVGVLTVNCLIWYLCFSSYPYFLCKCFDWSGT